MLSHRREIRPIRVLHCIPNLAGGGAERQLCLLARGLAEEGTDVHLAFVPGGENDALVQGAALTLHPLRSRSPYDPSLSLQLCSIMRRTRPDMVQTWLPQMDVLAGTAATIFGRPFILSERSSAGAYKGAIRIAARRRIGRLATAIVSNSSAGLELWNGVNSSPLSRLIRNGTSEIEPRNPSLPIYTNAQLDGCTQLLLFVGRYHADKNALLALDAAISALRNLPAAKALFLGTGPLRDEMLRKVDAGGMRDRLFIGPFAANVRDWMRKACVFFSLSPYEGQPNAATEAAFCGTPLVLSDIGPHREIFGDNDAFFVRAFETSDVSAVLQLAATRGDLASQKSENAVRAVAAFTVDAMVRSYIELYNSIVGTNTVLSQE